MPQVDYGTAGELQRLRLMQEQYEAQERLISRRPYDTWPRAWGSPREKDTQWAARDHRGNLRETRDFKALMRDNLNTRDT